MAVVSTRRRRKIRRVLLPKYRSFYNATPLVLHSSFPCTETFISQTQTVHFSSHFDQDCALSVLFGLLPICTPCFIIWQKNTNDIASSNMMLPFVYFFMWLLYSWKRPEVSFNVNLFCCVVNIIGILTFILYSNTATGRSLLFLFLWLWLVAWGLSSLVPSPMLVEWWWRFAIFRWVWSSSIQFLDEHIFCL